MIIMKIMGFKAIKCSVTLTIVADIINLMVDDMTIKWAIKCFLIPIIMDEIKIICTIMAVGSLLNLVFDMLYMNQINLLSPLT